MTSELSGNVIDLCPVGALTSRPYAFTARPWELKKTESVDVMDAVGSNIRVDSRGREVMRILPRNNDVINEEWISDKTRFIWDGLRRQRLDRPYVRRGGRLYQASWEEAFGVIAAKAKEAGPGAMAAIAGDLVCAESMFALKQLMQSLGVRNLECRQDGSALGGAPRQGYLFNTSIQGIERADALLLIGTDPRREAPLVNTRIRKRYLKRGFKGIGLIGPGNDLTYDHEHLGAGPKTLQEIAEGRHPFADVLKKAERPMLILGQGALSRDDGAAILAAAAKIAEDTGMLIAPDADGAGGWNGFNVLHTAASRVAGLDLGFLPQEGGRDLRGILQGCRKGDISFVYLLGADEIDMAALGKAFVVYQGSHGDAGASRADVVLPGAAYTEKNAFWVNTEGRLQLGKRAVFPPGDAREDWAILRALSAVLGKQLPYDSLTELRGELSAASPVFTTINYAPGADGARPGLLEDVGRAGKMSDTPFVYPVTDFYLTNAIARASETMAECSKIILGGVQAVQAAE
ncbi:MAG: molybdopterin-dependent oxidoreductase, partial [Alphaproteobacteria bacterium]